MTVNIPLTVYLATLDNIAEVGNIHSKIKTDESGIIPEEIITTIYDKAHGQFTFESDTYGPYVIDSTKHVILPEKDWYTLSEMSLRF